ncbi:MAG: HDIG domain-containing protein [Peptococcaceae bacterium]|nr:HDIG domain-containing protein [Peptococcaceae bacterium]
MAALGGQDVRLRDTQRHRLPVRSLRPLHPAAPEHHAFSRRQHVLPSRLRQQRTEHQRLRTERLRQPALLQGQAHRPHRSLRPPAPAFLHPILRERPCFAVVALLGGLTGCLGVSTLGQRSDISRTAFAIAGINAISITGLGLIQSQTVDVILYGVGFGIFNGLISSIFTMGVLPYLETLFGITTSIRLLELANPNQPLLKRLMTEAPGTYHHCIMVGNLGEAAADAIGANGLEVRLGAYYHDIGKLKRPYFFAENQFSGANPHDNITPQLSTLIITSHVKDGLEMAREEKLPPILMDMIGQHHGDSTVSYFYYKAKSLDENAREQDFRYENPKPQTKEAAILMMADTVEAAVRSKKDATPGQIEGFIRTLIKGKLNDGQFDECELTFRDLDQIAVAFARVINGIYHKRVEYPPQANLIAELTADEAKVLEAKAEQENMDNGALKEPEQKEGQE